MTLRAPFPCHRCGSTERLANGHCAPCEEERKAKLASRPCVKCGATERRSNGQCKACQREWAKAYYSTPEGKQKKRLSRLTPEAKAASKAARSTPEALQKRRQYRTQEQIRERERAYAKRPDVRLRKLGRQYKIGAAELLRLMREQDGKCAVCGDPLGPGRGTHVDHDHETGQVRGLLCRDCNLAEGMLHGSALRARKLAAYIEKHAPQLRLVNP